MKGEQGMEFQLKKWYTTYLDDFIQATDDPHLSDNLCDSLPYPMDYAFAAEYIRERMFNSEESQICRAIIVDGKAVGGVDVIIGTGVYARSAELSVWISKDYRGKGLGGEVVKEMCRYVFENYPIIRIDSHPYTNHHAAAAALKKAGFIHEGTMHKAIYKNDKAYDYEIFALINENA